MCHVLLDRGADVNEAYLKVSSWLGKNEKAHRLSPVEVFIGAGFRAIIEAGRVSTK